VGKKAAGPATPSPADYRKQAEQYWGNYGQWTADETARYEKDMARVRATQGASTGPNMSGVFADKRQKEYEARMQELKGGEHGKFLTDYYNEGKKSIASAYNISSPYSMMTAGSMDEFVNEYGSMAMGARDAKRKPKGKYGFEYQLSKEDQALKSEIQKMQKEIFMESRQNPRGGRYGGVKESTNMAEAKAQLDAKMGEWEKRKTAASSMSMEDFYAQQFGTKKAEGMSSEEQAKQRARMAGGRQRTGAGGAAGGAGTVSTATTSFGLSPQEEKTTWW
jgi:hypothetical protein